MIGGCTDTPASDRLSVTVDVNLTSCYPFRTMGRDEKTVSEAIEVLKAAGWTFDVHRAGGLIWVEATSPQATFGVDDVLNRLEWDEHLETA